MRPAHPHDRQDIDDAGTPTLLLVAALGVLAGVVAVVLAASSGTAWSTVLALVIVVVGLVAVSATIARQLDDPGD